MNPLFGSQPPDHTPWSGTSSGRTSSRPRSANQIRLIAAVTLLVSIGILAVPLLLWHKGKSGPSASTLASLSASESASAPVVNFGGSTSPSSQVPERAAVIAKTNYLKCMDPKPGHTPPDQCDHLAPIEDLVNKGIVDGAAGGCIMPPVASPQSINFVIDVSFRKKHLKLSGEKNGSTIVGTSQKKIVSCMAKYLGNPSWDAMQHAHQHYVYEVLVTFNPQQPVVAPPPTSLASALPTATLPTPSIPAQ